MKVSFKAMWLLAGLGILMLLAAGCNDTLRQFITPVPSPSGDPGTLAHAITLSTNPTGGDGSDMHIDVSGDSSVGIVPVGLNPFSWAKLPTGFSFNKGIRLLRPRFRLQFPFTSPCSQRQASYPR
jgi:hypothetical protein